MGYVTELHARNRKNKNKQKGNYTDNKKLGNIQKIGQNQALIT